MTEILIVTSTICGSVDVMLLPPCGDTTLLAVHLQKYLMRGLKLQFNGRFCSFECHESFMTFKLGTELCDI